MNARQIWLSLVLVAFAGLEAWVVADYGVVGLFAAVLANGATVLCFVDLCIALGMASVWVAIDARERGVSPLPYLVLTLALGSVGPLAYLIRRESMQPLRALGVARAS